MSSQATLQLHHLQNQRKHIGTVEKLRSVCERGALPASEMMYDITNWTNFGYRVDKALNAARGWDPRENSEKASLSAAVVRAK